MEVQPAGAVLRALGALCRHTPYFKGKWRITDWVFHRWLKRRHYSEVIELNRGTTIRCNLWDEVQNGIWWGGTNYERKETFCLRQALKPGMVFFDVGANVGYFSLLAVSDLGEQVAVHAFEPVNQTYRSFTENIERNGIRNIKANKLIVSKTAGRQTIYLGEAWNTGSASIGTKYSKESASEEVEAVTLDSYRSQAEIKKVDVIKIDVEGHELAVLKGAETMLREDRPMLFIEVREELLRDAKTNREELYGFLTGLGYRAYHIEAGAQLQPISQPIDGSLIVFRHEAAQGTKG